MELGTFGAILTYALEFENHITRFFAAAAQADSAGDAREAFAQIAKEGEKRQKLLERTRRECVAEMILEPIRDFRSEDYQVPTPSATDRASWVKQALDVERLAEKYYTIASGKVSVPEVARTLKKLAQQHGEQRQTLETL